MSSVRHHFQPLLQELIGIEHYFEMSRPDAERALNIYKTFGKQTDLVVQYLGMARQYESSTKLEVPKLKHAPTTLTASLEEYLNDTDFEINRRQYLAQQESKRTGKPVQAVSAPAPSQPTRATNSAPTARPAAPAVAKGPAPDLIDFFESIEQNQQPMAQPAPQQVQQFPNQGFAPNQQFQQFQQQPQATGYNPFLQQQQPQQQQQAPQPQSIQPNFTGAGFGGYSPQPQQPQQTYQFQSLSSIPQNGIADFSQQQQQQQQQQPPASQFQPPAQHLQPQQTSTNPFRQSMLMTGSAVSPTSPIGQQSTNPFAKHSQLSSPVSPLPTSDPIPSQQSQHDQFAQSSAFFQPSPPPPQQNQPSGALQPQRTGTNPFAKNLSPPPSASPLTTNVTGTNPFRQSQFVNQATGMGWQHSTAQGSFAGFDMNSVPTQQIFPRPGANSN